ncbi:hypothetical protein [Ornithinibacillus xuwenensis]|uniref:SMODS-associated NUDIX domain-containing protein n=1 Tax=Ornithinibacillus xuwenensis TaxID=3144668 RepID=A0ABU9XC24_9BACI
MIDLLTVLFSISAIFDIFIKVFSILVSLSTIVVGIIAIINIRFTKNALDYNERQFNFLVKNSSLENNPVFHIKRVSFEMKSKAERVLPLNWSDNELSTEIKNIGKGVAKDINIEVSTSVNHEYVTKIHELINKYEIPMNNIKLNYNAYFTEIDNQFISNENKMIYEDYVMALQNENDGINIQILDQFIVFSLIAFNISWNSLKNNEVREFDYEECIPKLIIRIGYDNIEGIRRRFEFIGETYINSQFLTEDNLVTRGYLQFKRV